MEMVKAKQIKRKVSKKASEANYIFLRVRSMTHLPANFPQNVLRLWTSKSNPLDSMSADEIKRRMKLGADTRSHFEALCRVNRAKQLNAMLEG